MCMFKWKGKYAQFHLTWLHNSHHFSPTVIDFDYPVQLFSSLTMITRYYFKANFFLRIIKERCKTQSSYSMLNLNNETNTYENLVNLGLNFKTILTLYKGNRKIEEIKIEHIDTLWSYYFLCYLLVNKPNILVLYKSGGS